MISALSHQREHLIHSRPDRINSCHCCQNIVLLTHIDRKCTHSYGYSCSGHPTKSLQLLDQEAVQGPAIPSQPLCASQCRSFMQVLRVDYPLPNTGLAYKEKGVVRGEKWWNRPGSAGASPKAVAPLQRPAATPPAQKKSPPAKVQVNPGSR